VDSRTRDDGTAASSLALQGRLPGLPQHDPRNASLGRSGGRVRTPPFEDPTTDFDLIYASYRAVIVRFVARLIGDYDEAQDIAQRTFLKVFEGLKSGTLRDQSVAPWLRVVARNEAMDFLRRRKRAAAFVVGASRAGAQADSVDDRQSGGLYPLLDHLTRLEQQVLVLRFQLDLSPREAALVLGKTPGAVRRTQHHAIGKLRRRFAVNVSIAPNNDFPASSVSGENRRNEGFATAVESSDTEPG
jgi:RNA polymerase sigma factor (sigma-70 family)